ncbi:MAG: TfoX/Sxy family protein [Rhodospirillales bacterium]|jgi:DNA transformation protein and related proteins|nr:TfoX/Sxy family protein [Rhodospirillales bacterium]
MAFSTEFRDFLIEMLEPLGKVTARSMFGGAGVYLDGTIIGLIAGDVLYFKVDDTNRPDFEAAGTGPFIPFEDKPYPMSYWEVPADVLEDQNELCGWARKAWEASRRSGSKKGRRRK